ncbi:MAG TPA: cyclase family protein [Terriglobia bacterium]|nr:cyclase family protein [Terriglobia bacterium]
MASVTETARTSKDDVLKMMQTLSNWGRWGKDDQLGALNLITPQKRKEAAALVKEGLSISLARNAVKVRVGVSAPFEHRMVQTGLTPGSESCGDVYSVQFHGFTHTHLDALCHVFHQGRMYNGYSQDEVTELGAAKLSVIAMKDGIFTRGILMDFPRLFGVKFLEGARPIYPEDIQAWQKKTGVTMGSGDAVIIRTGRWARWEAQGEWDVENDSAGVHVSCMPWFREKDVALLGSDLAMDVMPSRVEGIRMPVHLVTIVAMGVPILDVCDLEPLSAAAASRNRWDFLLTMAPLAVEGGTGSPINATATL